MFVGGHPPFELMLQYSKQALKFHAHWEWKKEELMYGDDGMDEC